MKVKLLAPRGGVGFSQNRGDVVTVPDDEAKRMIAKGQCEPVKAKREAAKPKTVENTSVE